MTPRHRMEGGALALVVLVALGFSPAAPAAESPRLVPFQGRVTDGDGNPLNGEHDLVFAIYDEETGGTALWTETHLKVPVIAGQVNVLLGSLTNLDDPDGNGNVSDAIRFDGASRPKFLGIKIGGDSAQELVPRHQLVPSFHARISDTVIDRAITWPKIDRNAGVPVGGVVLWWGSANGIPEGFELCDGQLPAVGTLLREQGVLKPDLRDRFPKGAGAPVTDVATARVAGGTNLIGDRTSGGTGLTKAHIPFHEHEIILDTAVAGNHNHGFMASSGALTPCDGDDGGDTNRAFALGDGIGSGTTLQCPPNIISSGGTHVHSINDKTRGGGTTGLGGVTGQPHTHLVPGHDNRPAFLELFFIIRVK